MDGCVYVNNYPKVTINLYMHTPYTITTYEERPSPSSFLLRRHIYEKKKAYNALCNGDAYRHILGVYCRFFFLVRVCAVSLAGKTARFLDTQKSKNQKEARAEETRGSAIYIHKKNPENHESSCVGVVKDRMNLEDKKEDSVSHSRCERRPVGEEKSLPPRDQFREKKIDIQFTNHNIHTIYTHLLHNILWDRRMRMKWRTFRQTKMST